MAINGTFAGVLAERGITARLVANRYQGGELAARGTIDESGGWRAELTISTDGASGEFILELKAVLVGAAASQSGVGIEFAVGNWSTSNYVLMPGAVYAGNRFECRPLPYSPRIPASDAAPDMPTIISDVPRLSNREGGRSGVQLLAGDMAIPAVAFHSPADGFGFILMSGQGTAWGDHGLEVEESDDRRSAWIRLAVPGVREGRRYNFCKFSPTAERGADFQPGDRVVARMRLAVFECEGVPALISRLFAMRGAFAESAPPPAVLPFAAAWGLLEEKWNRDNWNEAAEFFAVDPHPNNPVPWQTGWCGGVIAAYALLAAGANDITRERARRNLDWFARRCVSPSGFFFGKADRLGTPMSDFAADTARPHLRTWTLVRRQGDALLYLCRCVQWMRSHESGWQAPGEWLDAAAACAGAFARLWDKYGQLGQFADQYSGDLIVGGSASGAIVPGALCRAAGLLGRPEYLTLAAAIAEHLYDSFIEVGFTTGGPGDALQCPDSESAAAMVESLAILHEVDGSPVWLERGRRAAELAATWVMDYDYQFPPETLFGRLDMRSTGTVFANVQNKHSAPGICTHSGIGLLKLFRACGDRRLLELVRSIAHAIPQTVSRVDRPLVANNGEAMPSGWINERFNTSDWDDNVGGIFHGSTWAEVSMMLTSVELPGLYVQPDTGLVAEFDHVEARWADQAGGRLVVSNPCLFPANVRVMVETAATAAATPMPPLALDLPEITIPAGGAVEIGVPL